MSEARPPAEHTLLGTLDAMVWAEEFCRIFNFRTIRGDGAAGGGDVDPGTMVAWFANAIELGKSAGRKETCPHEDMIRLADDLMSCRTCGSVFEEPTLEESFVEGFQEGRPDSG